MMLDPISDVLVKRIKGIHQMVDVAGVMTPSNPTSHPDHAISKRQHSVS